MFRSALFKLTAAYVTIVMIISVSFSVVLYNLAVQELQTGFQNQYTRWLTEYRPYGLRQPGDPTTELTARANHIYAQLVYFNILVFMLTTIASYLLAKKTLRPIERAHEQQKRFTADVSHELRTPLTALKMDTEVTLLDPKSSPKQLRQTLTGNLVETKRMEELINNLLLLANLEADQLRTEFSRINARDIVTNAISVTERLARSKKITIIHDIKDAYVLGDKSSLTQLCVILLENAIKYSPKESTVHVTVKVKSQSVSIQVADAGQGIAANDLPHVFDRFYRADKARSDSSTSGFGLGLSLAKLIADLHNGEIILSSTPGKGTTAIFRLSTAPKNRH